MGVSLLYTSAAITALEVEGPKPFLELLGVLYRGQTDWGLFIPYDFPWYLPSEGLGSKAQRGLHM